MKRSFVHLGLAIALSLLSAPTLAHAAAPADSIPGYRSPGAAVLVSTLGTVVPVAAGIAMVSGHDEYASGGESDAGALLIFGGYLLGPSLGHFYAGRPGRALAGVGVRALATVAVGAAIAATWNGENGGGNALGLTGVCTGAFFTVYDIVQAGHSANVTNGKLAARAAIEPAVISSAPGAKVTVTF